MARDTVSDLGIVSANIKMEPGTKVIEFRAEAENITASRLGTEKSTVLKPGTA